MFNSVHVLFYTRDSCGNLRSSGETDTLIKWLNGLTLRGTEWSICQDRCVVSMVSVPVSYTVYSFTYIYFYIQYVVLRF